MHVPIGGHLVTKVLETLLDQRSGEYRSESIPKGCKQDMKEEMAYVALDFNAEMQSFETTERYELPGGQEIRLGNERFRCAEVLFRPSHLHGLPGLGYMYANDGPDGLAGRFPNGVASMVYKSITKCDRDIQKDLYHNVLLAGGGTMLRGMAERMKKDLEGFAPPASRVKVIAPHDRKYSVWIGGAILSSLSVFQQMWITRQEYEENGPSIVHRKCFS